jgi:hypothetical protein
VAVAATPPNTQYSEMPQGTGAASQDASVHQPVLIMQQRLWMWMFMAALSLGGKPVAAQEPAPESPRCTMPDTSAHRLPFSEADNADGARYVWFVNCRAGLPYSYVRTADVPRSGEFTEVDSTTPSGGPRAGDVAWWPSFMGIIASPTGPVVTPSGRIELADLEKRLGPARFFRRLVPKKP